MWFTVGVVVASFLLTLYLQSRIHVPGPTAMQAPTATEGIPIPVLFGTRKISSANVVWFGRAYIDNGDETDGIVRYYAALHLALCHGKLDNISQIMVSDHPMWSGTFDTESETPISANTYLTSGVHDFVRGLINIRLGTINNAVGAVAGVSDSLATVMGLASVPGYYGIASIFTPQAVLLGTRPYLDAWSVIGQRIHTRNGGKDVQWYDAKAEISIGRSLADVWKYKVVSPTDTEDFSYAAFDDSAWSTGPGGIGNAAVNTFEYKTPLVKTSINGVLDCTTSSVPPATGIWMRTDLGPIPAKEDLGVRVWFDDSARVWFNGTEVQLTPEVNADDTEHQKFNATGVLPGNLINTAGPNVVAYFVRDSWDANIAGGAIGIQGTVSASNKYIYAGISVGPDLRDPCRVADMNPIHMIRECLTDIIWANQGYTDDDIDDTSFRYAADRVYSEGLGISLEWDTQSSLDDFIKEILRHINGVLYWDRVTGLYCIRLFRDDYIVDDLITLDDASIVSVEDARRRTTGELVNSVTVSFVNTQKGDTGTVTVQDAGLIQVQGGVVNQKLDYPGFSTTYTASRVAFQNLKVLSSRLLSATIVANRKAAVLNLGDCFKFTRADLGINALIMRVMAVEWGDGRSNAVKLTAVEDAWGSYSKAVAVPAPVYWPPVQLAPQSAGSTKFITCHVDDDLNRGQVACIFQAFHACGGSLWDGWTETSPGVMERDEEGVISNLQFDGVSVLGSAPTTPPLYSSLVGLTVLAWYAGSNDADKSRSGPYVIDDVGGYWGPTEGHPETPSMIYTHAKMHRHPDYASASQFVKGMTFQVQTGDSYGTGFFTLLTADASPGVYKMEWGFTEGPTYNWDAGYRLATLGQLAQLNPSQETIEQVKTGFAFSFDGFPTVGAYSRFPGALNLVYIPAGDWVWEIEEFWIESIPVGVTVTLSFRVFKSNGSVGSDLFTVQVPAQLWGTTPRSISFRQRIPRIDGLSRCGLVWIPQLTTDPPTAITAHLRYNSLARGTGMTIPTAITPTTPKPAVVDRESDLMGDAYISGDLIVVPSPFTSAYLQTVPSGTTVIHGIDASGIGDGQELIIAFNCDSTHKLQFVPSINSGGQPSFVTGTVGGVQQTQTCLTYSVYKFKLLKRTNTWELTSRNG